MKRSALKQEAQQRRKQARDSSTSRPQLRKERCAVHREAIGSSAFPPDMRQLDRTSCPRPVRGPPLACKNPASPGNDRARCGIAEDAEPRTSMILKLMGVNQSGVGLGSAKGDHLPSVLTVEHSEPGGFGRPRHECCG